MYIQLFAYGIVASMILMGGAWAQTAVINAGSESPTEDAGTAAVTGLFDGLSPGNRMIAKSLFDAQRIDDGDTAWTLDGIALAKQDGTGWGNVFKQMKEEGLVPEKNLGRIVSGQAKTGPMAGGPAPDTKTGPTAFGGFRRALRSDVVVTTANGRQVVVALTRPGRGSRARVKYSGNRAGTAAGRSMKVSARGAVKARSGGRFMAAGVGGRRAVIGAVSAARTGASLGAAGGNQFGGLSRGAGGKGGKFK